MLDLGAFLTKRRREQLEASSNLLWENLPKTPLYRDYYRAKDVPEEQSKIYFQFKHRVSADTQFQLAFSGTINQLQRGDVQNILQYGAARRVNSISRSLANFCKIAPPNRRAPLSLDEAGIVSDSLLLIYVHILGVFDALAISICRLNPDLNLIEKEANLLSRKFRKAAGAIELDPLFEANSDWLKRVKNELRHRYVHRVPPYIPSSQINKKHVAKLHKLDEDYAKALERLDFDTVERIYNERNLIGEFSPWIAFSDSGDIMVLYPTVLDDIFRFQAFSLRVLEFIAPKLTFQ